MSLERFRLDGHLAALYDGATRDLAFRARTPQEFQQWKRALHARAVELLGLADRQRPTPRAEKLAQVDHERYVEEHWALDVAEGVEAPMFLLVPKTPPPWKTVLVTHGHNPGVGYVLGHYKDEAEAAQRLALDSNYAQHAARNGYFVCAIEQRGFGQRLSHPVPENGRTCTDRHLSFFYQMMGRTTLGERCWDAMCAVDYLQTRTDLVAGALAMTGNSGGGTTTLWTSALDERITVSIPSCYFCSFKASIMDLQHCECNYVPGIAAHCEMGDLAALIAPRPLRVIAGQQDSIFPIAAVREQFKTVQKAYDLLEAGDRCSLAVHPGPHAYNHAMAQQWLARWLPQKG